jgi:hypothetical protein
MRAAGTIPVVTNTTSCLNSSPEIIDMFLENETNINKTEPWIKLNKTTKIRKVMTFVQVYANLNLLSTEDSIKLTTFLIECLDRGKLHKVKEVLYNKEKGIILDIPILVHNKLSNRFTLKRIDKKVSTLKSLPTKVKTNGTGTTGTT